MQDNEIDNIPKGTFQVSRRFPWKTSFLLRESFVSQGDIHSTLEEINFAFNQVKNLQTHTFVDLSALMTINLEDNTIERIERRAFMNMNRLKYINLRGNKIRDITDEAFQVLRYSNVRVRYATNVLVERLNVLTITNSMKNLETDWSLAEFLLYTYNFRYYIHREIKLEIIEYTYVYVLLLYVFLMFQNLPDLEFLDLAYNNLNEFDFASFDQVGTLSSFKVNVSHNEISRLWINSTAFTPPTASKSHIYHIFIIRIYLVSFQLILLIHHIILYNIIIYTLICAVTFRTSGFSRNF